MRMRRSGELRGAPARVDRPDLVVWGLGTIGRAVLDLVATRNPRRRFTAITRHPDKAAGLPANVSVSGLDALADNRSPVLVCVSVDEAAVVREHLRDGGVAVARSIVAERNRALLGARLRPEHWRDRPVLMVTNPVESIAAHLVDITGASTVFGAGMQVDAERCRAVLAAGWDVRLAEDELPVTGLHGVAPIPVLSAVSGLAATVERIPWQTACARLAAAAPGLAWVREPARLAGVLAQAPDPQSPHGRVGLAASALMAGEFEGTRPPGRRGIAPITSLVECWLDGGRALVSGRCAWQGAEVFVGGCADLPDGRFVLPPMDEVEQTLMSRQLASQRET
ncbi:MAG: hypothetical protein ACJ72N_14395 [Labedaea sp.]